MIFIPSAVTDVHRTKMEQPSQWFYLRIPLLFLTAVIIASSGVYVNASATDSCMIHPADSAEPLDPGCPFLPEIFPPMSGDSRA